MIFASFYFHRAITIVSVCLIKKKKKVRIAGTNINVDLPDFSDNKNCKPIVLLDNQPGYKHNIKCFNKL